MNDKRFQPGSTLGECLNEYILAERHPRLDELAGDKYPEGKYWVGYRYLDLMAGPTVNVETFCDLSSSGTLIKRKAPLDDGNRWVFRAGVMDELKVAVLTEAQRHSLGLPEKPDWSSAYETQEEALNAQVLLLQGRALNAGGMSNAAVPVLEQALEGLPDSPEIIFELLFAYNATSAYEQVWPLINGLKENGDALRSGLVWREIAYSLFQTGDLENAAMFYGRAFELLPEEDRNNKAEIALNVGLVHFQQGDRAQGSNWLNIAWELAPEGSVVHNKLKQLLKAQ
jgi:tetratricopeptide (TPR) repeat protein